MRSVEQTARLLALEHRKEDQDMDVYWVPAEDEVRLIEVTPAITERKEVLPFRFTADGADVPYPSVVILLSPGDWERVLAQELPLPPAFAGQRTPI